jgi:hypothetical protein
LFTYGENLGAADCPVPLSGYTWHPTRPPVVVDLWEAPLPANGGAYSTIATWENKGKDVEFGGETYRWSKHLNFLHYLPVAKRCGIEFEVAIQPPGEKEAALLRDNGWRTIDRSPRPATSHRRFIQDRARVHGGEGHLCAPASGGLSRAGVCHLAAGRPVITQGPYRVHPDRRHADFRRSTGRSRRAERRAWSSATQRCGRARALGAERSATWCADRDRAALAHRAATGAVALSRRIELGRRPPGLTGRRQPR